MTRRPLLCSYGTFRPVIRVQKCSTRLTELMRLSSSFGVSVLTRRTMGLSDSFSTCTAIVR